MYAGVAVWWHKAGAFGPGATGSKLKGKTRQIKTRSQSWCVCGYVLVLTSIIIASASASSQVCGSCVGVCEVKEEERGWARGATERACALRCFGPSINCGVMILATTGQKNAPKNTQKPPSFHATPTHTQRRHQHPFSPSWSFPSFFAATPPHFTIAKRHRHQPKASPESMPQSPPFLALPF